MSKKYEAPRAQAIAQVVSELTGPTPLTEVVERVLAIYPSTAVDPRVGIRGALRNEEAGQSVVFLDKQTLLPIQKAMHLVRFRVPLLDWEVERGLLSVTPAFLYLHNSSLSWQDLKLVDDFGRRLEAPLRQTPAKDNLIFSLMSEDLAFDLNKWYREKQVRQGDSLLVTIEDWHAGRYGLEIEPEATRLHHLDEINARNQEMADLFYTMLEEASNTQLWLHRDIVTAYARLADKDAYPADHWVTVVMNDPRMAFDGVSIRYADSPAPWERILGIVKREAATTPKQALSQQEAEIVYRFAAWFERRPSVRRYIEIQAGQTLAELDDILRTAFRHDHSDHLGGFWKVVRRGQSNRFRQVDLGSIDPFGDGKAGDKRLADLDLQPGAVLKYVFDFGDWIEHHLEVQAIHLPEPGLDYPRLIEK